MVMRISAKSIVKVVQRPRSLAGSNPISTRNNLIFRSQSTAVLSTPPVTPRGTSNGTNPAMSFPCIDLNESRTAKIIQERNNSRIDLPNLPLLSAVVEDEVSEQGGPEPTYAKVVTGYSIYSHSEIFPLDYGGRLSSFDLAYETWGTLNEDKSNVILIHTGLSASSHAKSSPLNPVDGWWEKFIGPGKSIDTDKFFVICTNVLGGCYGSTGPSSLDPSDGQPYATRFPILSIFDMVRAQFHLLTHLGVEKLYASVGSSMGGMQSIAAAYLEPNRVGKVASISGTARSSPSSIAMRHAQRSVLMADPNWKRGFYYDEVPPHSGMKLARQIATITYRSGPEWEQRFGRRRRNIAPPTTSVVSPPVLCPDFLIETYLDHQGEQFCLKYDANSLIYISKAMDLFDMSKDSLDELEERRRIRDLGSGVVQEALCPTPPTKEEIAQAATTSSSSSSAKKGGKSTSFISSLPSFHAYLPSLAAGLTHHYHPTLIIGVQSDTLFPIEQQRELAESLKANGNSQVMYFELNQPYGHDTFLLDLQNVGGAIRGFLEQE